jgi:hypothetical protein
VQQLRLAAEALQPTRRALARRLDALQALLAALADRDQLGLDLGRFLRPPGGSHKCAGVGPWLSLLMRRLDERALSALEIKPQRPETA